jgi:hypothetical protein
MRCGHDTCRCEVEAGQEFCSDHCREHAGMSDHAEHVCECGHAACTSMGE